MRVLLLFPMADGQTGPAIKYAFEQLGHEVMAVDAKLDWQNAYRAAFKVRPDLIFCSRTPALASSIMGIKSYLPTTKICMWNVDTRDSITEWMGFGLFPLIEAVDYYFVVATKHIPEWKKLNPNTFWLPQGLQNEVYHKPKRITKEDRKTFDCDVSFAGSCTGYHAWRVPYLDAIDKMGVKFRVWGCEDHSQVYNEEHNKMVACSKINLGLSGWPQNGKYISPRNYKTMGAGGFLLERWGDGIFDVMQRGAFGRYEDIKELEIAIRTWLLHENLRKECAENGYKWVHAHATYTHRIQRALEIMGLK